MTAKTGISKSFSTPLTDTNEPKSKTPNWIFFAFGHSWTETNFPQNSLQQLDQLNTQDIEKIS